MDATASSCSLFCAALAGWTTIKAWGGTTLVHFAGYQSHSVVYLAIQYHDHFTIDEKLNLQVTSDYEQE